MKNKIIRIVILVIFVTSAYCQELKNANYYILICEKVGQYDNNCSGNLFYWIVPSDSIENAENYKIYPLYLDGYSNYSKFNCVNKKDIDIFTMTTADDYNLTENESGDLKKIIFNKKRVFFTSIKRWNKRKVAKMEFSIVPVSGDFCTSLIAEESGKRIDYFGFIYLALSNFKFESNLINSKLYNQIINSDFGNFNVTNE